MKLHNTSIQDSPHSAFARRKSAGGFTLIEILVVTGLFAILVSVGAIMGFDSISRSTVQSERDLVVLMLTGARTRALANVNQLAQGMHVTPSEIILFEGSAYDSTDPNNRSTPRNSGIEVKNGATPPVDTFDVVFDQLSASVTMGVGIVTLSQGAQTDTIDINGQGRIEW
ncbi:MAG: hypothetical protein A3C06_04175 [Candidatus Taylorbacteria bacterium RIFCSPHIGHO2_02_FULL_46_13]|uniref:General secretion pathway GspH domain-containing protein n=1 Tax=Candidatus Taylorbacteria bacterium RIFCSPHIGHO2_02_FULL_46_13 TaxID=1802312 RepID=A0A1G2MWA1_9BACT|nr:MAG: hypothetical protein A3C06_04175 [Candidatus Taylorbacteria bacterium RIFCSPHIGHO2_02_FULL_46_13]